MRHFIGFAVVAMAVGLVLNGAEVVRADTLQLLETGALQTMSFSSGTGEFAADGSGLTMSVQLPGPTTNFIWPGTFHFNANLNSLGTNSGLLTASGDGYAYNPVSMVWDIPLGPQTVLDATPLTLSSETIPTMDAGVFTQLFSFTARQKTTTDYLAEGAIVSGHIKWVGAALGDLTNSFDIASDNIEAKVAPAAATPLPTAVCGGLTLLFAWGGVRTRRLTTSS
jgi:hypothetical protein